MFKRLIINVLFLTALGKSLLQFHYPHFLYADARNVKTPAPGLDLRVLIEFHPDDYRLIVFAQQKADFP